MANLRCFLCCVLSNVIIWIYCTSKVWATKQGFFYWRENISINITWGYYLITKQHLGWNKQEEANNIIWLSIAGFLFNLTYVHENTFNGTIFTACITSRHVPQLFSASQMTFCLFSHTKSSTEQSQPRWITASGACVYIMTRWMSCSPDGSASEGCRWLNGNALKSFMIERRGAKSTRTESWIWAQVGNMIKDWTW